MISAFLASEFNGSLNFSTLRNYEEISADPEAYTEVSVDSKRSVGWHEVVEDILTDQLEEGAQLSEALQKQAMERSLEGSPVFGRTRGVLANLINQISSGSILVTFAAAVNSLTGTERGGIVVLILLGTAGLSVFWFLIQNTFGVILRRIFLEGHTYEKVPISRFLYLLRVKKWLKVSWNMLVKYIYQSLWSLTVIGGIIKHYSYFLVPYILAENPDMTANQSVTLSR